MVKRAGGKTVFWRRFQNQSFSDFGAAASHEASVMCQNLPVKMIISITNTKAEMARPEVAQNRMVSSTRAPAGRPKEVHNSLSGSLQRGEVVETLKESIFNLASINICNALAF